MDAAPGRPHGPLVPPAADDAAAGLLAELDARPPRRRPAARGSGSASSPAPSASCRLDVELLLVALAPDLDPRFERLYGYLHDDVSRRRASVGLALELGGGAHAVERPRTGTGWARSAPLVVGNLLLVEDPDRPSLTRSLRVPDRVAAHLLGDDAPGPRRRRAAHHDAPRGRAGGGRRGARAGCRAAAGLPRGARRRVWALPRVHARSRASGATAVTLDLARLAAADDPAAIAGGGLEGGTPPRRGPGRGAGRAAGRARRGRRPGVRGAPGPGDPRGRPRLGPGLVPRAPAGPGRPRPGRRGRATSCGSRSLNGDAPEGFDPAVATIAFRLAPEQIDRAARAARRAAMAAGRAMTVEDVSAGARAQNAAGLERLARRIVPSVGWEDLVLPPVVEQQLRELVARARHRERVVGEWRMGTKGARGLGITALFCGRLGHRQDHVGGGPRRATSASTSTSSTCPRSWTSTSARRRRTWTGSSPRRTASTASSCSTRRTPCSASAPRSRTPATATPTWRSPTCSSGWSASTAWRS